MAPRADVRNVMARTAKVYRLATLFPRQATGLFCSRAFLAVIYSAYGDPNCLIDKLRVAHCGWLIVGGSLRVAHCVGSLQVDVLSTATK